jgi:hypothetical protein
MSVEPTDYCAFNIKKVKGYSDGDFNLVYWLSELYAVKCSVVRPVPRGLICSGSLTNIVYEFFLSPLRATRFAHSLPH